MFLKMPFTKNCPNGPALPNKMAIRAVDKSYLKRHVRLKHWSKFKIKSSKFFSKYQNCTLRSALLNKLATREKD